VTPRNTDDETDPGRSITVLLHRAAEGERAALEEVTARVYRELEAVAAGKLRRRYGLDLAGATLEPAALVNETLFRLLRNPSEFENRRHFFAFANRVMSRVLIDYERHKRADKRGGDALRITLSGLPDGADTVRAAELVEVLEQLEALDARKAEVLRLRLFWGMENTEVAEILAVSTATVERDYRFARSWLVTRLST